MIEDKKARAIRVAAAMHLRGCELRAGTALVTAPAAAITKAMGAAYDAAAIDALGAEGKGGVPPLTVRAMNGGELARARKRLGLSVEQLAADLGLRSGDKIRLWERRDDGKAEVPTSVAIAVAHWLTDARAGVERTTAVDVAAVVAGHGLAY